MSEDCTITVSNRTAYASHIDSIGLGHQLGPKQPVDPMTTVNHSAEHPLGCHSKLEQQSVDPTTTTQQTPSHATTRVHSRWMPPEGYRLIRSAKIWFVWTPMNTDGSHADIHLLSYIRRGGRMSYDTLGGTRDSNDLSVAACLLRELREEVSEMPQGWQSWIDTVIDQYPIGHNAYHSIKSRAQECHHTTVWFVEVPYRMRLPIMSPEFYEEEGETGSCEWRPIKDIIANLNQSVFHQSLVLILHRASCRHEANLSQALRPMARTIDPRVKQQRRGLIEVCAGLGMMANSCVKEGFASVIATCENDNFCHRLLKWKHPEAVHYLSDVMRVEDDVWAKYRWDPKRPLHTAYMLVAGPPCTPYSKAGQQRDLADPKSAVMQYLPHLTQLMQPPLVVIENVENFLQQESWTQLQDAFHAIQYSLVHKEVMTHSQLGGATSRRRVFLWFQLNATGTVLSFPKSKQPPPFEVPQMLIRDILDPICYWRSDRTPTVKD